MKLKHRHNQERKHRQATIPVDSFSDIAFLLIVFFLVMMSLVKVKSITADLPTGEKKAEARIDKTPTINLRGTDIFFSDRPVTMASLGDRLAALDLPGKPPDQRIIMLESSDQTPYDIYFQALATISANGGVVALVEEEASE